MGQLKLPFLRRVVVFVFCDVLLFKLVGFPYKIAPRTEFETSTGTVFPPYADILTSQIDADVCKPLNKCPDTNALKETRKMCFPPPPPGYIYHCGHDPIEKKFVDFYYIPYWCPKGTFAEPSIKDNIVRLVCKDCPIDRFNPQDRYSPESMDECRSHYHKPVTATMHLILYLPGNRTDPAVYYCDHMNGWVSKQKTLFCKPSYQQCVCVFARHLCPVGDLLSDGRCVPVCKEARLPQNNFDCIIQQRQTALSTHIYDPKPTTAQSRPYSTIVVQKLPGSVPRPGNQTVTRKGEQQQESILPVWGIVMTLAGGFVVIGVIVGLICICRCIFQRKKNTNITINYTTTVQHNFGDMSAGPSHINDRSNTDERPETVQLMELKEV